MGPANANASVTSGCYEDAGHALALGGKGLDITHLTLSTLLGTYALIVITTRAWNADDGAWRAAWLFLPAIPHALARAEIESCASPLAFGHYPFVFAFWGCAQSCLLERLGAERRKRVMLGFLTAVVCTSLAVGVYSSDARTAMLIIAAASASLVTYLCVLLNAESHAIGEGGETLVEIHALLLGMAVAVGAGPSGFGWFGPVATTAVVGTLELIALLSLEYSSHS